jgi:signal transduction histidine kinase
VEAELSANRDGGRLFGIIVVFRDITERRRVERQNRQLQKMSALTLMATGLGRELAEAQNQTDAALKHLIEQSEGTTMRLLWDIFERSAHQQTVIQQLISLGKMDAGRTMPIDLNAFLTGIEEPMRKTLGSQRSLKLKLQPGVPPIEADARYLRENLLRLIADARHATAEGGTVEISTMPIGSRDEKASAQIVIRDNRKVVRATTKERVFDPYYQSGPGKRNPGFSLALVYQFVAVSGGRIELESAPGEGSAYLVSFPAATNSPVPPDSGEEVTENRTDHARVAVAA